MRIHRGGKNNSLSWIDHIKVVMSSPIRSHLHATKDYPNVFRLSTSPATEMGMQDSLDAFPETSLEQQIQPIVGNILVGTYLGLV